MKRKAIYLKRYVAFSMQNTKRRIKKMKKEKTLQEVQEQILNFRKKKKRCDVKLKQLQNQGKKLEKLANEKNENEEITGFIKRANQKG